jgi:hypothetical protein
MKSSVLLDKPMNNSLRSWWKIGVQAAGWTLGRVARQSPNQQIPASAGSPYQWPADEPCSVIASKEPGLCETMLGKEHPPTLDEHKHPGSSAEGSGQVLAGGRDVSTRARAV